MYRPGAVHLYFGASDEPLSGGYSLAWAEGGLLVHKFIWQSTIGTTVLYGAFLVHFVLGLFALYERRTVHWTGSEVAQLLLGLAVPPLLATHLAGTRIAYAAYGMMGLRSGVVFPLGRIAV